MINPRGLTVTRWTDATAFLLNRYGYVNPLLDENDWQKWAEQVNIMPVVLQQQPPNPYFYDNWEEWADRFCLIVGLGE